MAQFTFWIHKMMLSHLLRAFAFLPLMVSVSLAGYTLVEVTEVKPDGAPAVDMQGRSPLPEAEIYGGSSTVSYGDDTDPGITASYSVEDFTVLRTSTGISLSASDDDIPEGLWTSVTAKAEAQSTIAGFAFVEGAGNAVGGTVEFRWAIDPEAEPDERSATILSIGVADDVAINKFQAVTTLTASGGIDASGPLMNESHSLDDVGDLEVSASISPYVFTTDWTAGQEVPVFFTMHSTAELDITNTSTRGDGQFGGSIMANFSNSAYLDVVVIDQATNQPIPGATLGNFTAVPEPNAFLLCGLLGCAGGFRSWIRRRKQALGDASS